MRKIQSIEIVNSDTEDLLICIRNTSNTEFRVLDFSIPIGGVAFVTVAYGEIVAVYKSNGELFDNPDKEIEISTATEDLEDLKFEANTQLH